MPVAARVAVRNHGLDEMLEKHFDMSRKFFQLPVEQKMESILDENAKCAASSRSMRAVPHHQMTCLMAAGMRSAWVLRYGCHITGYESLPSVR